MPHQAAQRRRVEGAASDGEEQGVIGPAGEHRPGIPEVGRDRIRGPLPEGHDPLLAALAEDVDGFLVEVDVHQPKTDDLRAAQAA